MVVGKRQRLASNSVASQKIPLVVRKTLQGPQTPEMQVGCLRVHPCDGQRLLGQTCRSREISRGPVDAGQSGVLSTIKQALRHLGMLFSVNDSPQLQPVKATRITCWPQGVCPTVKGTPKWWDVMVAPVRNREGSIVRIVSAAVRAEVDMLRF